MQIKEEFQADINK